MSVPNVWSFRDCITTISAAGTLDQFHFEGSGADSITFDKGQNRATMQKAADGSIVFSSIAGEEGTVTIEAQQVSPLNSYLTNAYNTTRSGPSQQRAQISINSVNQITGDRVVCSNGIFIGEPADTRASEAQNRSWQILFANITFLPGA